MDSTPSGANVSAVIDHARPAPEIQPNVLHVLTTSSVQMEDVFHHAPLDNTLTLFQEPADHVPQHVQLAVHNNYVSHVQTLESFQLEDNACHAFTPARLVLKTC